MKEKETTNKKQHRTKKRTALVVCVVLCLAGIIGFIARYAVAKYYASKEAKGVSVASAFYFNSNLLIKQDTGGPATEADVRSMINGIAEFGSDRYKIPVTLNDKSWTGGDYLFNVEIRNYDNNLLYNESGLDIDYVIYFKVIGTPKGATYSVVNRQASEGSNTKMLTGTGGELVIWTGTLTGGAPRSDKYEIHINAGDQSVAYDKEPLVFVEAYPTGPDYIKNDTNQENRLFGLFRGELSDPYMTVSSHFEVTERDKYATATDTGTGWKDAVADQSGLIYNIRTGGDAVVSNSNSNQQAVCVTWDTRYLELSEYDSINQYDPETGKDSPKRLKDLITDDTSANTKTLTFYTLPNNDINITFYKTTAFNTWINESGRKKADFENLVSAYVP